LARAGDLELDLAALGAGDLELDLAVLTGEAYGEVKIYFQVGIEKKESLEL
jgi:hypothetical protein